MSIRILQENIFVFSQPGTMKHHRFLNGMANSNKIVKNDTLNFAANVDSIAFYLTLSPERTLEINVKNNSKDVLLIDTVHFSIGVRKIGDSIVSYYADN